jgi:hypothetical protein
MHFFRVRMVATNQEGLLWPLFVGILFVRSHNFKTD